MLPLGFEVKLSGPAYAPATAEDFEELLQSEGDDEADCEGDDVDENGDRLLKRV